MATNRTDIRINGTRKTNALRSMEPCAPDTGCCTLPAEFVRLRYFYGQRLGVVDLADEQSYLAGKQRFHNLRAHGVGVLCGLSAERYVCPQGAPPNTPTTLLRMRRGAALDWCGREIVVGWDQCIDVAAWLAQHPNAQPPSGTAALPLWVALCYRECPSDPAPAPRDPCGCDSGGCEFARIREGFQLKLLTAAEAELAANAAKTSGTGEPSALDTGLAGDVALLVSADCPQAPADTCLLLAEFQATLDAGGKVTDIAALDNAIPARRSLLRTEVLQQALLETLAAAGNAELIGSGPRLSTVAFTNGAADSGTLAIEIQSSGADLSRDPSIAPALITAEISLFDGTNWQSAPAPTLAYVPPAAPAPASIELRWAAGSGLAIGRYRVLLESNRAQPPVDTQMRPLTPPSWARHLRLDKDASGNLVLATSLF
jgi:hypothetical protein